MSKAIEPISIGVVGAGTMGIQIAALFSFIGHRVAVFDVALPQDFTRTVTRYQRFLGRNEKLASLRLKNDGICMPVPDLNALSGSVLIIECIVEDLEKKIAVLKQLEAWVSPDTALATNTSSLAVGEMASALSHPSRLVGLHFFNPVHAVPLVEMGVLPETPGPLVSRLIALLESLGRTVVLCPDTPGFLVNRLLFLMIASAIQMVDSEKVAPETIDVAMKKGTNMPLGPLELADLIGLDVCLMILRTLYKRTGIASYAPPLRLEELVAAGHLGKKTGRGFYS